MRKTTINGYPNPLASETEKASESYGRSYLQAMYNDWAGDDGSLLTNRRIRWQKARNYAGGKQSDDKYRDQINSSGDESYMNLDYSIVPIIPKFVDIVVNSLTNTEYSIKASAIDPVATDKRKADELKMRTKIITKKFAKEMEQMTGIPLYQEGDLDPRTLEEVDLFMQLSYKQAVEIAIEQGLKLAMNINEWEEIARRVIRDLVVIGIGAVKSEVDQRGVIIRYVDPMYLVTTYSEKPDFSDLTHAGEVRRITISELKSEAGDQLDETQYQEIAKKWTGKNDNEESFSLVPHNDGVNEYYDYDHFFIDVLDAQFKVPNKIYHEKKENRYGGYSVTKRDENYKPPKNSKHKREMLVTDYECKYNGKLIIGTDIIYDYGKSKNQSRAKSSLHKTKLDYIVYAYDLDFMDNQSLCERMIPFGDQIQLVHLKIQQIAAKARPKGLAMEVGSIENVPKGKGGVFTPLEIQDVYDQTGNYYFRYIQDDGTPTQARPITELQGGMGGALNELLVMYEHNLSRLRDVSGVNEARDGSSPSKDAAVGIEKLNLLASNNATRAINYAYLNIYRRVAQSSVLKIQDLVHYHKPYQGYVSAIGEMNMEAIKITKDVSLHEFGIIIEAEPDEFEKEQLYADIQASIKVGELRIEDAIMIRSIKNIKLANQLLILRRKKYAEEKAQEAMQAAKANAAQQSQSIQQKAQTDMQLKQAETQLDIEKTKSEYGFKDEFEQRQHQRKLEQIEKENEGRVEAAGVNNEQKSG